MEKSKKFPIFIISITVAGIWLISDRLEAGAFQAWIFTVGAILAVIVVAMVVGEIKNWAIQALQEIKDLAGDSAHLRLIQTVARLTTEQARLVPRLDLAQRVRVYQPDGSLHDFLMTPEGLVDWKFVEKFLKESNVIYLFHIGWTGDKSEVREAIQGFTAWCIAFGYCIPAEGPHAARWVTPESRGTCAARLGIKLYEEME